VPPYLFLVGIVGSLVPLVGVYRLYRNYADRRISGQARATADGDTEFDVYRDPWVFAPRTFFTRESVPDLLLIGDGPSRSSPRISSPVGSRDSG
jgi:hypothetical protein